MRRPTVQRMALVAVVLLATALRVYQLKDLPAGFFCDEAGLGYNAFTIATAGMDENGTHFPLYFWSFGVSYKNPIFIYAAALPVKLLGLDEFSVRLTSALFGVGTVIAIFYLGRALFTPWVGFFAALFLALCPWHLHFSRIAFELISFPFLFVIGFTLLVRYTQGRRTLAAGLFFCGLCPYAYQIANLFVPLFLLGFGLLFLPELLRRWRETAVATVVFLATVGPAGWFLYSHQQLSTQYFRNTTMIHEGEPLRETAERFQNFYLRFFSREFLLEKGDPIVRHAVRDHGELLPFYAPFVLIGAAVCLLRRDRPSKLVLWWLAIYPVAPSLMTEIPSASRGIIGAPALSLLTGIGVGAVLWLLGWLARWRPLALAVQSAAIAAGAYFLVPQMADYLHAYFVDYPAYSAPTYGGFQYGYRDTIHYMESQRPNYDLLMLTAVDVNQPQVFPLFYNHIDPRDFQRRHDLGYTMLDPAEYGRYNMNQRILYALRPGDLDLFSDYVVHRRIVAPGGRVEFVIADVKARKRYLTNWLVLGPFLNDDNQGVQRDFIDVNHLSKNRYPGAFGDVFWRRIAPQFVRVNLNVFFATADPRTPGNPEHVCAYAVMTAHAPAAESAFIELSGTDDYAQLWLNGRSLTPSALMLDERVVKRRPIDLAAGDNLLILKSCENVGGWYFTARITDADGHDIPDVTTNPEIPESAAPAAVAPPDAAVQMVEGFDSIITFKHDSDTYPDYRGGGLSWFSYVHDQPGEVAWHTAACPERRRTVFVFTASSSDEAGEAELYVNGTYALNFQLGPEPGVRTWARGPYKLSFASRKSIAGNSGIMLLDVPAEQITAGKPVELRVIPARGKDDAWFMIKSYRDTVAHEQLTGERAADIFNGSWTDRATE